MFVYAADTWCDSCGEAMQAQARADGEAPEDPSDEYSFDSDDYPKGPYPEEPTDGPDHCAAAGDCLEGIELGEYGLAETAELIGAEGRTIGALLSDGLTEYGVDYLRELLEDNASPTAYQLALYRYWREVFAAELER